MAAWGHYTEVVMLLQPPVVYGRAPQVMERRHDRAGARTQVSQIVAAGMVPVTLPALISLFHNLPEAVLTAPA